MPKVKSKKEELVKHYVEVMDPHLAKVLVREGAELEQWVAMMQEIAKAAEENGVKA